jgi:hypothetical protein
MDFPPESWDVFPSEEFGTAAPRAAGPLNMELFVQVRPNGRMLDHFRICLGGNRIVDAQFQLANLVQAPALATWKARYQIWPKDIDMRRNMATTGWKDLATMVASRNIIVLADDGEPLESAQVSSAIQDAKVGAAVRFAVVVGEDQSLVLQLQGLPAPANTLMGKPAHRG